MIYDCFMYRNEADCLDIRLHELADVVDRFVLVEADWTFQATPKPPHFTEHAERFAEFADRIIHIELTVAESPNGSPWVREAFQRNAILRGLLDAGEHDIALVGDVDEIPSAEAVLGAAREETRSWLSCEQALSFYYVDNVCYTTRWHGTQMLPVGLLRHVTPQGARDARNVKPALPDAGWHFCNLTEDPQWLIEKIESFSHTEVNLPEYKDPAFLKRCIAEGREMTGRADILFRHEPDPPLPAYITRERFPHLFVP